MVWKCICYNTSRYGIKVFLKKDCTYCIERGIKEIAGFGYSGWFYKR